MAGSEGDRDALASLAVALLVGLLVLLSLPREASTKPAELPKKNFVVDETPKGHPYVSGELVVTYETKLGEQDIDAEVDEAKREDGARNEDSIPTVNTRLLSFPKLEDQGREARESALQRVKEKLERDPDVSSVSYNNLRQFSFASTDPRLGEQWALQKIGAPTAWNESTGAGVKIAIIDSGIEATHPDLKSKILDQYDFVWDDPTADDVIGHGTAVAGVAAAATNNAEGGIAGTCPDCELLIAKVSESEQGVPVFDVAEGTSWAANHGADVINLSLAGPVQNEAEQLAVDYAWSRGAVIVAAAGNDAEDGNPVNYPAAYENVIAVGATDSSDVVAPYSSYGDWVDVVAPGGDSVADPDSGEALPPTEAILTTDLGESHSAQVGTSFAAPHVAGLAALLKEQKQLSSLSNNSVRKRIETTTKDLGPLGRDQQYGYGRIDAATAVAVVDWDSDDVPNSTDNCQDVYNPLQADNNPNVLGGDACQPIPVGAGTSVDAHGPCPATGTCGSLKISLKDQNGRPVVGASYELRRSDGGSKVSVTPSSSDVNYDGVTYIDQLPAQTLSLKQISTRDGCELIANNLRGQSVTIQASATPTPHRLTTTCGLPVPDLTPTSLTLSAAPTLDAAGKTTLWGKLTTKKTTTSVVTPLVDRQIVLEQRPAGASTFTGVPCGTVYTGCQGGLSTYTDSNGTFSFAGVKPVTTTEYRVRFLSKQSEALAPAVTVKTWVGVTNRTATADLKLGGNRRILGEVTPAHPGKYVKLTIKRGTDGPRTINVPLDASSSYSYLFKPPSTGFYTVSVSFAGDADHFGVSPARSFKVVP